MPARRAGYMIWKCSVSATCQSSSGWLRPLYAPKPTCAEAGRATSRQARTGRAKRMGREAGDEGSALRSAARRPILGTSVRGDFPMLRFLFVDVALALGPAAYAQVAFPDSLDWEAVGEAPHDSSGIAFAPYGTLWGVADRIWRLPPGSNVWEEMGDRTGHFMLALGPDTRLYAVLDSSTDRSLDDGQTWSFACECGGPLFAADLDGPSRGALLGTVRDDIGIAYSHDRG